MLVLFLRIMVLTFSLVPLKHFTKTAFSVSQHWAKLPHFLLSSEIFFSAHNIKQVIEYQE